MTLQRSRASSRSARGGCPGRGGRTGPWDAQKPRTGDKDNENLLPPFTVSDPNGCYSMTRNCEFLVLLLYLKNSDVCQKIDGV